MNCKCYTIEEFKSSRLKTKFTDIGDIYFESEYVRLFGNQTMQPRFFYFEHNNDFALYPFLIRKIDTQRLEIRTQCYDIESPYGYSGVLSTSNGKDFRDLFYNEFREYCTKNNVVAEFVRFNPLLSNHEFATDHMETHYDRETVFININHDYKNYWENTLSAKTRNVIRKADKLGYRCELFAHPSNHLVDAFIDIYQENMRFVSAVEYYYFNRDFFYETFKRLVDNVILAVVFNNDDEVIASSIFLKHINTLHYHLSGRKSGSDNSVTPFMLNTIVKYAYTNKYKGIHLGGGRSTDESDSLLKFKSKFSEQRLRYYIGKYIHNHELYIQLITKWEKKYPNLQKSLKNVTLRYNY